jgi:hypothetical protein
MIACAQTQPPPTFTLSAPSSCTGADAPFTCSPIVNVVDWTANPNLSSCGQLECHLEYCFGQTLYTTGTDEGYINCPAGSGWSNTLPSTYGIGVTTPPNGSYTVYPEYRVVAGGGPGTPCKPGSYTITRNETAPTADVNSPAGILNAQTGGLQTQNINGTVGQWVTYAAAPASGSGETVTVTESGCPQTGACSALLGSLGTIPPYMWLWTGSGTNSPPDYNYVMITAVDEAGNTYQTTPAANNVFSLFDPSTSYSLTCNPSGSSGSSSPVQCAILAGQSTNDIPNDSPSAGVTQCASPYDAFLFSGYGDPSMRADQLLTGGYGTNLWMLYSYLTYKWSVPGTDCSNTTTVETHLAYSNANQGANAGQTWVAWCSGDSCDTATPIWPSEPYCGSGGSVNGTPCTSACAAGWATCFSSHEVPNFWPYLNTSASPITESWVAVHLMYYVEKGQGITPGEIADGCLVMSMASTPSGLGWALGSGPNSCTPTTLPPGDQFVQFNQLTTVAATATNRSVFGGLAVVCLPGADGNCRPPPERLRGFHSNLRNHRDYFCLECRMQRPQL